MEYMLPLLLLLFSILSAEAARFPRFFFFGLVEDALNMAGENNGLKIVEKQVR